MNTKRNSFMLNRHRYEIAAAVILTLSAIGFLAAAAFSYKSNQIWSSEETIQSPLRNP
ncbi:MAG: hypothetical protein RIC14_10095 [Filomicrobium sp.]